MAKRVQKERRSIGGWFEPDDYPFTAQMTQDIHAAGFAQISIKYH
jgi:hypothetical protein